MMTLSYTYKIEISQPILVVCFPKTMKTQKVSSVLTRRYYLSKDHGGDLLSCELFLLSVNLNNNMRLGVLLLSDEGEEFDVLLYVGIAPGSTDKTFSVEDGVGGVARQLVLSGVSDQTLSFLSEGYV